MAMSIPMSRYRYFTFDKNLGTRWGQQFYDYMKLEKITSPFDKVWCDSLYQKNASQGRQMVLAVIDHQN